MTVKSNLQNFLRRIISVRSLTLLLIWIYMLDLDLKSYREAAMALEIKDTFAILPFVQADGYLTKVILMSVVCFFSNAPFMSRGEMPVILRIGRERWGKRNIAYIFASGAVLALLLVILSVVLILPTVCISNAWGGLYKTFAFKDEELAFGILDGILNTYTPAAVMGFTFLVDTLAFATIGMLVYACSLYVPRIYGFFVTGLIVFLPTMENVLPFSIRYFSPFSWIEPDKWRYGTALDNPNMTYIITAFLFINFILILLAQRGIYKVEWNSRDEDEG